MRDALCLIVDPLIVVIDAAVCYAVELCVSGILLGWEWCWLSHRWCLAAVLGVWVDGGCPKIWGIRWARKLLVPTADKHFKRKQFRLSVLISDRKTIINFTGIRMCFLSAVKSAFVCTLGGVKSSGGWTVLGDWFEEFEFGEFGKVLINSVMKVNFFEFVRICSDLPEFVPICPNLFQFLEICPNSTEFFEFFQISWTFPGKIRIGPSTRKGQRSNSKWLNL